MRLSVSVTGCAKLHQSTPYRADKICAFGATKKAHAVASANHTHIDLRPLGFAELCGEGGPPSRRRWMRGYYANRYLRQRRK